MGLLLNPDLYKPCLMEETRDTLRKPLIQYSILGGSEAQAVLGTT